MKFFPEMLKIRYFHPLCVQFCENYLLPSKEIIGEQVENVCIARVNQIFEL